MELRQRAFNFVFWGSGFDHCERRRALISVRTKALTAASRQGSKKT